MFTNASGKDGHVLDRATGKIVSRFNLGYACTRFTCSRNRIVLGANLDLIDLSGRQSAGDHRPGDRLPRVRGVDGVQRPDFLHVAGQRPAGVFGSWRGGEDDAYALAGERRALAWRGRR